MVYPRVGLNFEVFIIEEIIKGLEATMLTGWEYFYYRTRNGAEVDMIIQGDFGVLPIEIKFGLQTDRSQLASLKRFVAENNLPMAIVINNSEEVAMLADGIIQIPVGLL